MLDFCKLSTPDSSDTYDDEFMQQVEEIIQRMDESSLVWPPEMLERLFSNTEIIKASKKLTYQKAPGCHGVTTEHIRCSSTDTMILIMNDFQFNDITGLFMTDQWGPGDL